MLVHAHALHANRHHLRTPRNAQVLGDAPSPEDIASGAVTPLFFGSAFNNFGVDLFLQARAAAGGG